MIQHMLAFTWHRPGLARCLVWWLVLPALVSAALRLCPGLVRLWRAVLQAVRCVLWLGPGGPGSGTGCVRGVCCVTCLRPSPCVFRRCGGARVCCVWWSARPTASPVWRCTWCAVLVCLPPPPPHSHCRPRLPRWSSTPPQHPSVSHTRASTSSLCVPPVHAPYTGTDAHMRTTA